MHLALFLKFCFVVIGGGRGGGGYGGGGGGYDRQGQG